MSLLTSVIQQPRLQPYGSILLNPSPIRSPVSLPSSYPSRSNHSLDSSTSSSEEVNTPPSSDHATPPALSIPYASDDDHPSYPFCSPPLPPSVGSCHRERRRTPLPSDLNDDPNTVTHPGLPRLSTSHSSSLLLGDGLATPKDFPTILSSSPSSPPPQRIWSSMSSPSLPLPQRLTDSSASSTVTITSPGASSTRFAKRLLLPFRQKVDCSGRSASRDSSSSRDDPSPSRGTPLGRWTSADTASRSNATKPVPLSRVQSAGAVRPPNTKRLLNGRVYGARKHPRNQSTNVFANASDEPEFVEWGHGGWKLLIGHTEERGRPGAPQPTTVNDDDGSGMGWVKRRREERERKKREEQLARESADKADPGPPSSPISAPEPAATPALSVDHKITTVTPTLPIIVNNGDDEDDDDDDEDEVKEDLVDDESSGTEQEDEDTAQERHLMQVVGAGVERVSRHRD
ncbi:hypothetical protein BGW80DRAFT_1456610 [Lactifluus volemus]|nr:hypothetical protein BGW80DRAFT_1456610 [Lactifluus volemus]